MINRPFHGENLNLTLKTQYQPCQILPLQNRISPPEMTELRYHGRMLQQTTLR